MGQAIGAQFSGAETPAEIGEKTAAATRALMRACGIKSPKEMGLDRQQFVDCYKMAMEIDFGLRMNCPVEPTAENVKAAYERTYDNYQ